MSYVLITRPQPDAGRTAKLVEVRGLKPLISPLFSIHFSTKPPQAKNYQAVLATSRNAVRALHALNAVSQFATLPFFAVGEETASEAEIAGFRNIQPASGTALSLAKLLEDLSPQNGTLLYLAGKHRTSELEKKLAAAGFEVIIWEGYDAREVAALTPVTLTALKDREVSNVLLFSERACRHFLRLAASLDKDMLKIPAYVCLSEQIAKPLETHGFRVMIAAKPSTAGMIELLGNQTAKVV